MSASDLPEPDRHVSRLEALAAADDARARHSGRMVVVGIATIVLATVVYFALGMPGMDHGDDSSMAAMDMSPGAGRMDLVDPGDFERSIAGAGFTLINVHVPYEGEIPGTELFVPFDALDPALLPQDKDAPLLIYCMSGNMSAEAARTLSAMGYTDIVELDGGMRAWSATGRTLTSDPDRSE